jgi:hypothetical protein
VEQKCKNTLIGSNNDSLFSTNSFMIAPESHPFILYLREPIFFHGDVIRDDLTHDAASLSERSVYLRWGLLFLMAMARAFFVPIMTTSFFALVIPV